MADEGFKHKLAAILSADVEGYNRLIAALHLFKLRLIFHSHAHWDRIICLPFTNASLS